jgi:hypothetical protein
MGRPVTPPTPREAAAIAATDLRRAAGPAVGALRWATRIGVAVGTVAGIAAAAATGGAAGLFAFFGVSLAVTVGCALVGVALRKMGQSSLKQNVTEDARERFTTAFDALKGSYENDAAFEKAVKDDREVRDLVDLNRMVNGGTKELLKHATKELGDAYLALPRAFMSFFRDKKAAGGQALESEASSSAPGTPPEAESAGSRSPGGRRPGEASGGARSPRERSHSPFEGGLSAAPSGTVSPLSSSGGDESDVFVSYPSSGTGTPRGREENTEEGLNTAADNAALNRGLHRVDSHPSRDPNSQTRP